MPTPKMLRPVVGLIFHFTPLVQMEDDFDVFSLLSESFDAMPTPRDDPVAPVVVPSSAPTAAETPAPRASNSSTTRFANTLADGVTLPDNYAVELHGLDEAARYEIDRAHDQGFRQTDFRSPAGTKSKAGGGIFCTFPRYPATAEQVSHAAMMELAESVARCIETSLSAFTTRPNVSQTRQICCCVERHQDGGPHVHVAIHWSGVQFTTSGPLRYILHNLTRSQFGCVGEYEKLINFSSAVKYLSKDPIVVAGQKMFFVDQQRHPNGKTDTSSKNRGLVDALNRGDTEYLLNTVPLTQVPQAYRGW